MKAVFADTFFFLAILNPSDHAHIAASRLSRSLVCPRITTAWVLTEVADAMARTSNRHVFVGLLQLLERSSLVEVIPATQDLFERGVELYCSRLDKDWTLTDCVSFVVMQDEGLTDAMTGDRHFEQAGFRALLK